MIRMNRNVSIFSVVVVMIVTVLATVAVALAQEEPRDEPQNENGGGLGLGLTKITICHKGHVITVAKPAWPAHDRHGDTIIQENLEDTSIQENPEDTCGNEGALPEEPSEGATLTTDATDTAALPDGTISDMATLSGATSETGTITFNAYGPDDEDCSDDPAFTSEVDVAGDGETSSEDFVPVAAGTYRWTAEYIGDTDNETATSECNAENEQSVVREAATTATEQNMTLAAEIGGAANPADPATDTTNIEGTNQNENSTLGTDNNDDLYGDSLNNNLYGLHGNDFVNGGRGADKMLGGAQNDSIYGADGVAGNDVINGGIGTDYCVGDEGDKFKNCDGNVVEVAVADH